MPSRRPPSGPGAVLLDLAPCRFTPPCPEEPELGIGAAITGVLCGRRDESVTLGPMYLLDEVQGHGIGGQLMGEFSLWADGAPIHLWVTEYNGRAIRFYGRYGFRLTGERELWRDRLPNVRMARDLVQHPGAA
ncbi:GNAT family N-acetyltransferase [Streptomyces microflavus]|uniref:GNAT family N-acetyltransferase n=1 Tax=Streptomyces microflavus TaxID=1919 RepID=UPI003454A6DB